MHGARPLRSTRRLQNLTATLPRWYRISNTVRESDRMEITVVSIYDEIGFMGVSAADFMADLRDIQGDIEMHVNSPGGDVWDGIAIYNQLKQRAGSVHVIVDGLAASAASFIAMAASPGKLEIAPHAQMMIHDGFGMVIGNAADMRQTADLLEQTSDEIAGIYADRTGKPASYWREKMRAETWYTDKQAVAEGLADRIHGQEDSPSDQWDLSVFARYSNDGSSAGWRTRDGKRVFDPEDDGDDDSSPETDTDHDYWSADGTQLKTIPPDPQTGKGGKPMPKAGNRWHAYFNPLNADKYTKADRDRMAKSGEAMEDGSYPIADEEDLHNAIHAVGRGGAEHDEIRRHVIKRAKALGLSSAIPDNWNSDGSLKDGGTDNHIDPGLLSAALAEALEGGQK